MSNTLAAQNKKIWILALTTAAVSVLFSLMGAPFLRAFSTKARPALFWGAGAIIVTTLFLVQLTLSAIYVGSMWTTLGAYTELEKRGVSWKKASLFALLLGILFTIVSAWAAIIMKLDANLATQISAPILQTMKQLNPEEKLTSEQIIQYVPGALIATLICSMAIGLIFESKVFELFQLQREKTVSALKWLEFRLPDPFIWVALMGFLFSLLNFELLLSAGQTEKLKIVAINISIFSLAAFFLQGISVFEYLTRFYRVGPVNKALTYGLIFLWLAPAIGFIGLIDYWADFRKMARKKKLI